MHNWWVLLHVAGALGFSAAHGVSMYASFRLRQEREPARVLHLLELSSSSVGLMWNGIGLLLLGGVAAGFTGDFWGQGWIWAAIVILLATIVAMYALARTWTGRLRTISAAMAEGTEAVSQSQFEEILRSRRPHLVAVIGFAALLASLYLMFFKPTLGLGGVAECPPAPQGTVAVCAFDDQRFVPDRLEAPAGEPFEVAFLNQDAGVEHNVAIYSDETAAESLFVGDLITGADSVTYEVPSIEAGSYYFRCDVHPIMDGTLEVA